MESRNEAGMTGSSKLCVFLEKEKNGLQHPREPRGSPGHPWERLRAREPLRGCRRSSVVGFPFEQQGIQTSLRI